MEIDYDIERYSSTGRLTRRPDKWKRPKNHMVEWPGAIAGAQPSKNRT